MKQEPATGCFTNVGKQVLANGVHYADFADDTAAAFATAALNKHAHEGSDTTFGEQAMLGYGHAAFCGGWSAAIKCTMNPGLPAQSGYDWLSANPPAHLDEPLWRGGRPSLQTRHALARVPTEERVA